MPPKLLQSNSKIFARRWRARSTLMSAGEAAVTATIAARLMMVNFMLKMMEKMVSSND